MSFVKVNLNSFARYTVYIIELVVFFMIQQIPDLMPLVFGVKPILIFVFAITLALLENEAVTLIFSLFAGVLMDYSLGITIGGTAVALMIVCCVINAIVRRKISITIFSSVTVIIIGCGIMCWYLWYFYFVFRGYSYTYEALLNTYIPVWFYTSLVSPLIYILNIGILHGLEVKN